MSDAQPTAAVSLRRPLGSWPLIVAVACISAGLVVGPLLISPAPDSTVVAVSGLVALLLLGLGVLAVLQTPDAPPTAPFLGLVAASAVLTALLSIDAPVSKTTPLGLFLIIGPWRYLLTPVVVHFALAVAWNHQQRFWLGIVTGWYALHTALFVATAGGIAFGEAPLLRVVDGFFLRQTFEPIGATLAVGALLLSLASANRRASQRQAVSWTLAAVLFGLVPAVVTSLLPEVVASMGLPVLPVFTTLPLVALFGLGGILSLPMVNPRKRDLAAYRLAQRLLDDADLQSGIREAAEELRRIFEAEAVVIRIGTPEIEVTVGTPRRSRPEGPFVPEAETFEERRSVVAPIGRSGDPLGEVYLEGRFPGAFGRREREWLLAVLGPISSTIRVRRREAERTQQLASFAGDAGEVSRGLARATGLLPELVTDDGRGLPLPVDASEVLTQLSDGSKAIGARSDGLERAVVEARAHTRSATDAIARAVDGLAALGVDLAAIDRHGEAIALSNDTVSGVAFRTNLLANTAALEASRAGAAGRTFTVLAEEIRRLADATAEASSTITAQTAALAADGITLQTELESLRRALTEAIREAEASEVTAHRITELAAGLESSARALWPAIEEANMVAARRSARDEHLTATMESFMTERAHLAAALTAHRDAVDRLGERLEGLARAGRGRNRPASR